MSICNECWGKGWIEKQGVQFDCRKCKGTGVIENEPMTNEEWFASLTTEEKAKVLRRKTYGNSEDNEAIEQGWSNWLKAKHEDNPPDIPSVPSWDKWLQGEKTKCEYCDGTNAECNLAGSYECPRTPKTEQEYIQTCNTEQLAEVLAKQKCDGCHDEPYDEEYGVCKYCMAKKKEQIMEWLKQPHKEEKPCD